MIEKAVYLVLSALVFVADPTSTVEPYDRIRNFVAKVLSLIDPLKAYGTELFNAICRLVITVCVECASIRRNVETGVVEILLVLRGEDEPAYPGHWNNIGSAKRVGESDLDSLNRVVLKKAGIPVRRAQFVGNFDNLNEARGHWLHLIYLVELDGEPKTGTWFPVDDLPEKITPFHATHVIPMAKNAFTG